MRANGLYLKRRTGHWARMLAAATAILCAAGGPAGAQPGPDRAWISAWATSVQDPLPTGTPTGSPPLDALFPNDRASDQSFRLIVRPQASGDAVRLRLSNLTGMAETFAKASGVPLVKVAYRSNSAALTDVIAGRVSLMFVDMSSSVSFVRAGSLRPLAVTTKARGQLFPELPTISETAVDGYDLAPWTGLFAPAGTPGPVTARLNQEVNAVLALPDMQERFAALGIEAAPLVQDAFAAFVRAEVAKWSQLVRDVGLQPD